MERFLKAKHWQIFMITIGLPIILEIVTIPFMVMGRFFGESKVLINCKFKLYSLIYRPVECSISFKGPNQVIQPAIKHTQHFKIS